MYSLIWVIKTTGFFHVNSFFVNVYELWEIMSLPEFKIKWFNGFALHLPFIMLKNIAGIPMEFPKKVHNVVVSRETHDKLLLSKKENPH